MYHYVLILAAMFYFLLGNIRPAFRSQLKAIQLVAIANTSVVEMNGIDAILEPLMDDIKLLEKVNNDTVGPLLSGHQWDSTCISCPLK